jgi:NADPH-dependent glutamate synthase beta subunit-like oxidoreductase
LKRAALDHSDDSVWKINLRPAPPTGKKVAIIGAGPSGLTAAWFLKLKGHDVVVFDSQDSPGGWLRNGIPRYRLSPDALDADVRDIAGVGVEFNMGVEVGREITFGEIRAAHDAVFIAVGARNSKQLPCEGVDLPQVENGLELLQSVAARGDQKRSLAGEKVVIIGGGNVAVDVARTAVRLGADEVHLYCLEERDEMPAHSWEIEEAEEEGVIMHPGWGPTLIAGNGKVERVDFRKCVSVFDADGRFAPQFHDSVTTAEQCNRVMIAIGQEPSVGFVEGIKLSRAGTVESNPDTMQTSLDGVFAGGEVVMGPASVIEAIAQGRKAASGIDRYLGGDGDMRFRLLDDTEPEVDLSREEGFFDLEKVAMPRLSVKEAVSCFSLVESGYGVDDARREAERCLRCDLRLLIKSAPSPPEAWFPLTDESVAAVPESEGVYQLLDEAKEVYAIKGVQNLREALSEIVQTSAKAKYFLFDVDPMYSKRESELIQEYLKIHGCMPPGEGEDDLDDLF